MAPLRDVGFSAGEPPIGSSAVVPLGPALRWLLSSAGDQAGMALLVAFGQDPGTFDTAAGFSRRLHCSLPEVALALASLAEAGILWPSPSRSGDGEPAYLLSQDPAVCCCLREFVRLYVSGPAGRRQLVRALPSLCPLAA